MFAPLLLLAAASLDVHRAPAICVPSGVPAPAALEQLDRVATTHILRAWNVTLAGVNEDDAASLAAGFQRLPCAFAESWRTPLRIEGGSGSGAWGMPEDVSRPPDDAPFRIVDYSEPSDDPRASWAVAGASVAERRRLWRARAAVHALVSRFDTRKGWSRTRSWRRVAGWNRAGVAELFAERPFTEHTESFSRKFGARSSAADLAVFAEEVFVPAESIVRDRRADDHVACLEPTRWALLAGFVAKEGAAAPERPACPGLDAWLSSEDVVGFEVLFAAPSSVRPETLFGHVILRPLLSDGELARGPSFERAMELAALTGQPTDLGTYLWRGLFGGFFAPFEYAPFASVLERNNREEQRTIRRFRLTSDEAFDRRLRARLWHLERRGYAGYRFFDRNCAGLLLFVVDGALDEGEWIEWPSGPYVMPAAALDALTRVAQAPSFSVSTPRALIRYEPDDLVASRERAEDSERRRKASSTPDPGSPGTRLDRALREADEGLRSVDRVERRRALEALVVALRSSLPELATDATLAARTVSFLTQVVRLGRYDADRTALAAARTNQARILPGASPRLPAADTLLSRRILAFRPDDARARTDGALRVQLEALRAIREAPRRAATEAERQVDVEAEDARAFLASAAELLGTVPTADAAGGDDGFETDAMARESRGVRRSGASRTAVTSGALFPPRPGAGPGVFVQTRTALHAEGLGEVRQHGFGSLGEFRLLDADATWRADDGRVALLRADATLVGFRSLPREPDAFRTGLFDHFGLGVSLVGAWNPSRPDPVRTTLVGELLLPLWSPSRGESHVVVVAGAWIGASGGWLPMSGVAGARVGVLHRLHLGGSSANAFTASVLFEPGLRFIGERIGGRMHALRIVSTLDLRLDERTTVGPVVELRVEDEPDGWQATALVGARLAAF